jgi:CysZ protein
MSEDETDVAPDRPGLVRRAAAGAWHVPGGFAFLLRRPGLWPLAVLPAGLALVLMLAGAALGLYLIPHAEAAFEAPPGARPWWIELPSTLLLWVAMVGSGVFLGLGAALLLASPLLDHLSKQVEVRVRGTSPDAGRGLAWELAESLRAGLYVLVAAPGVFLLGLIPLLGPFLSALWGAQAVTRQMTDPSLTRRGLGLAAKWRWHREWWPESQGFGLAGMVALLVPFANLVLAPALVVGGTLLVLALEPLGTKGDGAETKRPAPAVDCRSPGEAGPDLTDVPTG